MKSILNKIYIHPLFLLVCLLFILLGRFRIICYFMLLITIHELGHILTGLFFKWKINRIIILPFGCLTKFDIDINTRLLEEFMVSISGIMFQYIFFIIIRDNMSYYFSFINYFLLVFNMLPIYPLDGSKLLNIFLNITTNFYNSLYISTYISFIVIIIINILMFNRNKLVLLITIFLLIETIKNYKNIKLLFNKFLLERYIKKYRFNRFKTINNVYKMKKDYRHIFYIDNKCITEYTFLSKMFDNKGEM